jgi:hypothetical protein
MTPEWKQTDYPGVGVLHELVDDETGETLGWVQNRPDYCDRGHWHANIERGDLDAQDAFPRYFMRLATAKQEMMDFVRWRYMGIRAEHIEKLEISP